MVGVNGTPEMEGYVKIKLWWKKTEGKTGRCYQVELHALCSADFYSIRINVGL